MKKYIIGTLVVAVMFVGVVSLIPRGVVKAGDPTTNSDTGVAAGQSTHDQESAATEKNQQSLIGSQPIPSPIAYSLERQNLINKLKVEAKQGLVGYVALIGPQGQLVAYYTVQGKVSSLNSMLTTSQQIQCPDVYGNSESCVTVDSPDLDGSYGANPSGIFFFTTSGQYIEWSGSYLYSDQPLNYTTQPLLTEAEPAAK
jgi:hypothetical protein